MAKKSTKETLRTYITWGEAEELYPRCSIMWDINGGPARSENLGVKLFILDGLHASIGGYNFADYEPNDGDGEWTFYMLISVNILTEEYYINEPSATSNWDQGQSGLHLHGIAVHANDWPKNMAYMPQFKRMDVQLGQTLYGLYEHYTDGSTFGSNEYTDFKDVFLTEQDAQKAETALGKPNHGYFGSHIAFRIDSAEVTPK